MKPFSQRLMYGIFLRGGQIGGIFILAMIVGGPRVRHEFFEMTSELARVSSRVEFAKWTVRSQFRLINATKVDWKPISVFPEEAKKLKKN